jgi:predicted phosphodiesterase
VRTLVISDLHLGSRLERDVLRRPEALDALLRALETIDRLVLLGDVVEMLEGRPKIAMRLAEPVLRAIGEAMGHDREIVVVPGNHDHLLVRPWLRRRREERRALGLATRVPVSSSPQLKQLGAALAPARVQVRYPGVWIGDRIWATHGHYLDRHLVREGRLPLSHRVATAVPVRGATAWSYELASGASIAALSGLLATNLPSVLGEPLDRAAGLARSASAAMLPLAGELLTGALAPLSAGAMGFQFRRRGLPAMAEVAMRLHVRADHVIFGHLHRLGPRHDDDREEWAAGDGRRMLHNSGCWVYEPLLLAGASPPHPYWPGGAVLVEDGGAPRTLGLLDLVDDRALR